MTGRRWFYLGLLVGVPVMAFGAQGILRNSALTSPVNFVFWFVGGNLVHDFLLAPFVFISGYLVRQRVPARFLARVQWALALTGIVALFALIPLAGLGHRRVEPTVQPLNYPLGLSIVVAAIWVTAFLAPALRRAGRGRSE